MGKSTTAKSEIRDKWIERYEIGGPAQTAALTRRGNTHHVLPMSLD